MNVSDDIDDATEHGTRVVNLRQPGPQVGGPSVVAGQDVDGPRIVTEPLRQARATIGDRAAGGGRGHVLIPFM